MAKVNKEAIISFKVEVDTKEAFEQACNDKFQTVSQTLYSFVQQTIKHSKAKSISINQYKRK